jgi:hypothetical protein
MPRIGILDYWIGGGIKDLFEQAVVHVKRWRLLRIVYCEKKSVNNWCQ